MRDLSTLSIFDDLVSVALLGALVLLVGVPSVLLITWRTTRLPFRAGPLRWTYLAWALVLAASSVWSFSRQVRFSVEEAGADSFVRLAFLVLGVLTILLIGAKYRFTFIRELTAGVLGIFSAFALWGLSSTLWSVSPAATLYKSVEYCAMLGLFALAATLVYRNIRHPHNQLLGLKSFFDWNWFLVCLLLISVYAGLLIWPDYAIYEDKGMLGYTIQGVLPGIATNGVGQLAAIVGVVTLARMLHGARRRFVYAPLFLFSLVTMLLAQSRSPMLAFAVAAAVVLLVSRRFLLFAAFGGALSILMLSSAYSETVYEFLRRGQSDSEITTLTGRTEYWEASMQALRESPLTGYGANAGGIYILQSTLSEAGVSTVHSTWVEVLLDTGIVGAMLLLVGLVATVFYLFKLYSQAMSNAISRLLWFECLGVLTVLFMRSVFSVTFVWSSTVLNFGLVLVFIAVMRRQVVKQRYAGAPVAQPLSAARRRRSGVQG
jgi:O-antigen ligase